MNDKQIQQLEDKKFLANKANRAENTSKILSKLDELKPLPLSDFPNEIIVSNFPEPKDFPTEIQVSNPTDLTRVEELLTQLLNKENEETQIDVRLNLV